MNDLKIGLIGLGSQGMKLAKMMQEEDIEVLAYDASYQDDLRDIAQVGSLRELVERLQAPKCVWMSLSPDVRTSQTVQHLSVLLPPDSIVVDTSSSDYRDTQMRAALLRHHGIHYLDIGITGELSEKGSWMVGGDLKAYHRLESVLKKLNTVLYTGLSGSGHFLKMVHDGIQLGVMQAMREGLTFIKKAPFSYELKDITKIWKKNSFLSGPLLEEAHEDGKWILDKKAYMQSVQALIASSVEANKALPIITLAQMIWKYDEES